MSYGRLSSECQPDGIDRLIHPDFSGPAEAFHSFFYRAEPVIVDRLLPNVRPSVLYIFGSASPVSTAESRQRKLERTGNGVGGSGGAVKGRVREAVIEGRGHLVPLEAVAACADDAAPWIEDEVRRWKKEESSIADGWAQKNLREKGMLTQEWVGSIKTRL